MCGVLFVVGLLMGALACEIAGIALLRESRQCGRIVRALAAFRVFALAFAVLVYASSGLTALLFVAAIVGFSLTMLIALLTSWSALDRAGTAGLLVIGMGMMSVQALPIAMEM